MSAAEAGRFFCTAGRGLEPFLAREVRARLGATEVSGEPELVTSRVNGEPEPVTTRAVRSGSAGSSAPGARRARPGLCRPTRGAGRGQRDSSGGSRDCGRIHPEGAGTAGGFTRREPGLREDSPGGCGRAHPEPPGPVRWVFLPEVDCVSGKVFFRAAAGLGELRQLRSGERLFLLLKKHSPLPVSGNRGKMLHEIKSLVIEDPKYWLDIVSAWRKLHGHERKTDDGSIGNALTLKRKSEEETNTASKRQKTEQVRAIVSEECQVGAGETCEAPARMSRPECWTESRTCSELPSMGSAEDPAASEELGFSFRVSCRCSGAIARTLTSQEVGRALGTALVKQCGWRADLRDPDLEIFVHLNDIHSVVGIPLFRLPLANREYIRTAGLRSTVAWAMASLAEIRAGALVLDPMCGLGTILLEAAKEWPDAWYWGADISDSQLEGADGNIRAAGLVDKIELLKASVKVEHSQDKSKWNAACNLNLPALPLPSESFDSVISDIPFGKKFKTTSDAQLLPDLLQEMERVLRVGGTLVLLLSQELHRLMDGLTRSAGGDPAEASADGDSGAQAMDGLIRSAGGDPADDDTGAAPAQAMDGLTRSAGGDPADGGSRAAPSVDGNSSSLAQGDGEPVLSRHFGSLLPERVYAVSLGKTDAFIHKYRKVSGPESCPRTGTLPGAGSSLALG